MPNENLAKEFLSTAECLLGNQELTEAEIRRAISSCYYAVFHALAKMCADCLIGTDPNERPNRAWVEVYRSLGHTYANDHCKKAQTVDFPDLIIDIANNFIQLQAARHKADYDPNYTPDSSDLVHYLNLSKSCLKKLSDVEMRDRIAFSSWILISGQGTKQARADAAAARK